MQRLLLQPGAVIGATATVQLDGIELHGVVTDIDPDGSGLTISTPVLDWSVDVMKLYYGEKD